MRFREVVEVCKSFLRYLNARSMHVYLREYCAICASRRQPLARGAYLIRVASCAENAHELSTRTPELFVCRAHHPTPELPGATLAHETREYLNTRGLATHCIYPFSYRQ